MSLNTAHAQNGVLIYAGECIIIFSDNVEFNLKDNPQSEFKGTKKGRIYLTTHRVIFNNKSGKDPLQSFSSPFHCLRNVGLEQPVFGANYIKGNVVAEQGGRWQGEARFSIHFMHGGAIEFGQALLEAGKRSSRVQSQGPPPPYSPPTGPYYPAQPPAYMPPPQGYGFHIPTEQFPDQPPPNSVYATQQPPPYPGINLPAYYPPPNGGMANQPYPVAPNNTAYYNPNDLGQVYAPAGTQANITNGTTPSAPPSYEQATNSMPLKKEQ